ncbi:EamA family transporter [Aeromicrobium sp. YIM 150415]|uniref:EamA family transporter n=1 Tax=Aeromicrobium sp. YIM 150415 TaxID=2803912 RepID=UPI00196546D7|nr:EamA family transporter [Aeromicrobium sp. YIM 150415]MBM9462454.1 EamA family transporter [Aeromicrobium sp. YIM 150415]
MSSRPAVIGYALVVTAAVTFGVNAGVSRIPVQAGLPIDTYTTFRLTCAALVFIALALVFDRSAFRVPRGRAAVLMAALAIVGVLGVQAAYNVTINRLPLGIALLLEYLAPALVVLWVRFVRREPVHPRLYPAIAVSLVGLALVGQVWDGLTIETVGLLVGLLSAVCLASYFLIGEALTAAEGGSSPLHVVVWSFGLAAVVSNLYEPAWNAIDVLGEESTLLGRLDHLTAPAWVAMIYIVLLGTVTPFFLYLAAMQYIPSTRASVVAMLEPVVALVTGWLWYAEVLSLAQSIGVFVVLTGVVVAQTARLAAPEELPPPT